MVTYRMWDIHICTNRAILGCNRYLMLMMRPAATLGLVWNRQRFYDASGKCIKSYVFLLYRRHHLNFAPIKEILGVLGLLVSSFKL